LGVLLSFASVFRTADVLVLVKLEGITSLGRTSPERHKENGAYFVSMRVRWANGRYRNDHPSQNDHPSRPPEESQDENGELDDSSNGLCCSTRKQLRVVIKFGSKH